MNLSRIGDIDLTYDGVALSDHFIVANVAMPLLPTFDSSAMYIDGKPGAWFTGRKIGTRDIRVTLKLLSDTKKRIDAMETWIGLSGLIAKDKVCKLELGNGYYVNAIMMDDSPLNRTGRMSTAEITFRCFDPYIYGEEHTVDIKSGSNIVVIEGQCPVWPTFEITGHSTSAANAIRDTKTGYQVRVPSIAASTAKLVVDMAGHYCTLNGNYKACDPSVTDFFQLPVGENTISLSYGSGIMKYTEMYL